MGHKSDKKFKNMGHFFGTPGTIFKTAKLLVLWAAYAPNVCLADQEYELCIQYKTPH